MRKKFLLAIIPVVIAVLCIVLPSCSRNHVAVDFTNAKGEVPQLGNLVFRFSKPIHPDSLLNNWDSTEYISFDPEIEGRFRWDAPDELVFSPSEPLLPATTYKAKVRNEVLGYSEYNDVKDGDEIRFYTSPLQLNDAQVSWVLQDEGSKSALPQVLLQFNYPVKAEELKDKLEVEVDGAKTEFLLQNIGTNNEIAIRLKGIKTEDKEHEARITIQEGLKPEKGANSLQESIKTTFTIPSPFVLNITSIEGEHDGNEGVVRIYTSQQLNGESVTSLLRFDPQVSYTTEQTENGLVLRSDQFDSESAYLVMILKGLRGKVGGVLREDYQGSVGFGELEAGINFTNSKAVYLSKKGSGDIEVKITNVPKVKMIISRIYENNLLMAERHGYYPQEESTQRYQEYDEEEGGPQAAEYLYPTQGDIIYSKEIQTSSLKKTNGGRILNISQFEDRLPESKGIYHVTIFSEEHYWVRDSRFISFSDIGLIAKQGADKMFVFANSLKTALPMQGVNLTVYGANNQLLGTGSTNGDGAVEIKLPVKNLAGFKPAMIVAKTGDDFTYLPFNSTRVNTSRFEVGGKRINPTGLDAFIYAERDIYRPGERMNFSVLLRDRNWKSPGELPVKMKLLLPNGKELKSFRRNLNEQGGVEGSVDISGSAITGSYLLEVYSSNDVLLGSKNFMIEEFVPDRIKVTAKLDKPFIRPSESATVSINAMNFFGPPAANRNFEVEVQVQQQQFKAKKYAAYDFTLANQTSFMDAVVQQGTTDEAGNASYTFDVPGMYANTGLLKANFFSTVFDETGRPVSRRISADVVTQDVFHGIRNDGYYYYALNQPASFYLVSVNKDGAPVKATARMQVIKHEYRTVLRRSGGYFRYDSQEENKIMVEGNMEIGANSLYTYVPRSPGSYELRLYRPGSNAYVSKTFYSYGSWGADNSSFEVSNEGHIDMETDKAAYEAGEMAKVLFKTPFSGRMLVTMETDKLISYQYVDVSKRSASIELKMAGTHVPNVYITATLIKPHEVSDIPLTVAHGFKSIKVEEKSRQMPVTITAQQSVRSKTHQRVSVKAAPGSYVTLAAVDNGVLQVSGFKTPDPYAYYYQKKALGVQAFDMYPLLFPELRNRLSSTGGDGELSMDKRVNPMPAKRFKLMSYWSGIKKANGSGVVDFEFDLPQFNGEVRLMALAYKDERFGAAEASVKVADPLVVSSALPRFLSPGDTVKVPVTISNTTGKAATGQATIAASGPVRIMGAATQSISIQPNTEAKLVFNIVADPKLDVAKITVNVAALGEKFTEVIEISVRPASTLQKISGSGAVVGNSTQRINIPANGYLPGSFRYNLVVSRSPVAELSEQLRYLVQYPYGCTEQTISAAFPQLYYADFIDMMDLKGNGKQNANANVLEAIRKIKMRQLYNGAVTLWDGEGTEDWWTSIYAAHFLLEARKAGFDVDNSLIETMLNYIAGRLKTKETIFYYYNRDKEKKIAPKEVAYGLYVLSLANRSQVSAMNYYKSNPQLLALDSRYLLSAAYAISGDRRSFSSLLPRAFSGEESVQQTGGSFYSATRDEAIALDALIEVDPNNGQVAEMAKHVSHRLKSEQYLNTQERAFSFLALGKLARMTGRSDMSAEIRVNGKKVGTLKGNDWKGNSALLKSNNVEIVTKGNGRIYYSWQAEGISSTGDYVQEDQYVKVRRQFFDRHGNLVQGNSFKQNDLVVVEITLDKAYGGTIENIVITDLLPAGFEIENPRTKEIPGMEWITNASNPVSLDIRDDRIHFFVDAREDRQKYYYAVRAVSPGQFKQGPVSADAMYNGEIHSYHGAGTIIVRQ
jgi:hypothetical protein